MEVLGHFSQPITGSETPGKAGGRLAVDQAFSLLEGVAQEHTQWSVVYGISSGEVHVAVGQKYEQVYRFKVEPGEP